MSLPDDSNVTDIDISYRRDAYLINGVYASDIELLLELVSKEELMVMIKRGFISLYDYHCNYVKKPYISMWDYLKDGGKWHNIQCPLHSSMNDKCNDFINKSNNHLAPCEVLSHYLTGKLIYRK